MRIEKESFQTFEKVYTELYSLIYRIAYHVVYDDDAAEDVTQEAFVRLYHSDHIFSTIDDAKYWTIRVVKNLAINQLRKKKRSIQLVEKMEQEQVKTSNTETGEDVYMREETIHQVRDALTRLPENLRLPIILREYGDMSYSEIAQVMGISESNVKVRIHRGRANLERLLNQEELYVPR